MKECLVVSFFAIPAARIIGMEGVVCGVDIDAKRWKNCAYNGLRHV